MKNTYKLILGALALIIFSSCSYEKFGNRFVFDDEGFLGEKYVKSMEDQFRSLQNAHGVEVILLTTDNYATYDNIEDYAEYVANSMKVGGPDMQFGVLAIFSKSKNEYILYSPSDNSKFLTQELVDEIMLPQLEGKIGKFDGKAIEYGMRTAVGAGSVYWLENVFKETWVIDELGILTPDQIEDFNQQIEKFNELTNTHFIFILSDNLGGYNTGEDYWFRGLANHTVMRSNKQIAAVHFDSVRHDQGWIGAYPDYQDEWSWEVFNEHIEPYLLKTGVGEDFGYKSIEVTIEKSLEYLKDVFKDRIKPGKN